MSGPREKVSFILGDATLTLYAADEAGAPILATPIWFGACAENIAIRQNWIGVETRPTGRRHPHRRALVSQWSIDIARVWTLQKSALDDFEPGPGPYVLDVVWEEEAGYWHRLVFYGVTPTSREFASGAPDERMTDGQQWDAEYAEPSSGQNTPPAVSSSVPLSLQWVGSDGTFTLYAHNATSGNFTESSAGITTGRATAAYTPSDQSGKFEILFASGSTVALRVTSGQVLEVGTLVVGAPGAADVPRVDFVVGNARVASVTLAKKLFVFGVDEVTALATGDNQFQIKANSALSLVLSAVKAGCVEVRESL